MASIRDAKRVLTEAFNTGDTAVVDELVAEDYVEHTPVPGIPPTRDGLKRSVPGIRAAFSRFTIDIEDEIVEEDKAVYRCRTSGRHTGDFRGIAPTGRDVSWASIHVVRMAGGKIVEHWAVHDMLSLLMQLGALPEPS